MPMCGPMSVLVRSTVKSLKRRSVLIKAGCSACCSSSLCLKPCHASSALGSPGKTLFADGIIAESFEKRVRRLLTWKEAIEEKGLSKCIKDKDHDLCYRPGPTAEFRQVAVRSLSHWSGQQQHLLKQLQALSAQEMQRAQVLGKGP